MQLVNSLLSTLANPPASSGVRSFHSLPHYLWLVRSAPFAKSPCPTLRWRPRGGTTSLRSELPPHCLQRCPCCPQRGHPKKYQIGSSREGPPAMPIIIFLLSHAIIIIIVIAFGRLSAPISAACPPAPPCAGGHEVALPPYGRSCHLMASSAARAAPKGGIPNNTE